jgi:DNA-binding HxlR family transcriptional regulator
MANRSYGQYCGLALALDRIGDRWTLLIVRELLPGPARFGELHEALPGIATNLLTRRLRDLEEAGLLERKTLPSPANVPVYELSALGQGLGPVVREISLWGVRFMDDAEFERPANPRSMVMGMSVMASTVSIDGLNARLHLLLDGYDISTVMDGQQADFSLGVPPEPDAKIETDYEPLIAMLRGRATPDEMIAEGTVVITGDQDAAMSFFELFRRVRESMAAVPA